MNQPIPCTGIVLAGGQSSRMRTDKALLLRDGKTQLQHTIDLLMEAGCHKVITSRNETHCIADQFTGLGPLGGIHAAIKSEPLAKSFLIVPVDMPKLTKDALQLLMNSRQACFFERTPLPCFLPAQGDLIQHLEDNLHSKKLTVRGFLEERHAQSLKILDHNCLINTNTPAQWQSITNNSVT